MSKSNKAAKSALTIIIFTLGSKFLGFLREVLIAAKFGSGIEVDTFVIALSAAGLIGGFITSAINTIFIPVISEVESKEGKKGKIDHTNNMINVVFIISIVLTMLALIGTPLLIKLLASGFEGDQFDLAVNLTRIGLPTLLFSGTIGIMTGYLQSEEKFKATALIGFPMNFVYIIFLIFFSKYFGIKGLMTVSVLATVSQLLIQLPEAKNSGFKYKFKIDLKDKYLKRILYLSMPVFLGVAIGDLNAVVDKTLASSLVEGSISALNYSLRLNSLISGVFITAITTVVFPLISKEANSNNIDGVKSIMAYGFNLILLITVPATVGIILLSTPIVQIVFQRGKFDSVATMMTSSALVFYSLGLVATSLRLLITRVYYALQDTKTPMINGAISVAINIVLNLILVKYMSHAGLALATSIATSIATIILLYGLKKKIGSLGTNGYIITFLKTGLASAIMGIVAYFTYYGLYNLLGVSKLYNLVSLVAAVGLGIIVYGVFCYLFKIEEVRDMVDKIKLRLKRIDT